MRCNRTFLNIPPLLVLLFILLNCACKPSGNNAAVNSSDAFDKVIRRASSLYAPDQENAYRLVDSAYNSLTDPTIKDKCKLYSFKGIYFRDKGDYTKSMSYADSTILIVKLNSLETELAEFYGQAHLIKGDVLMKQKYYNNAFKYFYEGRAIIRLTNDTCLYDKYSARLADLSYKQENYLDAAHYFKEAFNQLSHCDAADALKKYQYQQANLDNAGLSYDKCGMVDSAIYYYNYALSYLAKHENEFPQEKVSTEIAKGVVYGNLATSYVKKGKLKEAEMLFKKSISINTKKGYANEDAQLTQLKLADLYLKISNLREMQLVLKAIQGVSIDSVPKNIKVRWLKLQSDYYAHTKDFKTAASYLNTYATIKDAIDDDNKKLAGLDFNKTFQNIELGQDLAVLKKDDQLKTFYLNITFVIGALIILTTGWIWQNRKRLGRLNKKIGDRNTDMHKVLNALEQSQNENIRMIRVVSHDLRSPMAATISIAELLLENHNLQLADKELLELMKTSSQHSLEMIADLLHMHIDTEELQKQPVELHALLHYCVEMLKFKASEKKQEIALETFDIVLDINREKIWRVFSNLIVNAIKFSPEGELIYIWMQQDQDSVLISIQDQGVGIPEYLKDKIFNIFAGIKRPGTAGEQSFGYGLAICRQIVEAHGGQIWFESEPDKGTTFFVKLNK